MVMLDYLPDVGVYGEGFHFLESEKEHTVGNFFPDSAEPHEAFPRVPVFQAEKDVKVKLAGSHFFGCGFYVLGPEAQFAFVKFGGIGICKGFRIWKAEIVGFDFLPESPAEQADSFLDCGDA